MRVREAEKIPIHFILSTGRTGSTLLSSMFNAHPHVISISEEPFAMSLRDGYAGIKTWDDEIIKRFINDFFLFSAGKLGPQFGTRLDLENILNEHKDGLNFEKAVRLCYFAFFPLKKKERICCAVSKELIYHTQLRKLARSYGNSKFILLLRDPRDNMLVKMRRAEKRGAKYNVIILSIVWRTIYSMLSKGLEKHAAGRFLPVRYEDLVMDPAGELKRICYFLGLEFSEQMLEYDAQVRSEFVHAKERLPENVTSWLSREHEGLTKKTYLDKIGFWKTGLKKEVADLVWTVNGPLAKEFGYLEDRSFTSARLGIKFYLLKLNFFVTRIWIAKAYHRLPFRLRRFIKNVKYGKRLKESGFSGNDFYKNENYKFQKG